MSQTAERYSKALFELAQEKNDLETVQNSLTELKKVIDGSNDFRLFLSNPLLDFEERCTVLKTLFQGKMPELLYKFLVFITYKNRLNILKDIIESFDSLYLLATQQMRIYIKTALPLKDDDKALIDRHLQDKFHQKMLTQWTLDSTLIGGFRIFAQGKLYDYSFRNQLDHFLQQSTI